LLQSGTTANELLVAANSDSTPSIYASITSEFRVGKGLYVGGVATSPSDNQIWAEGIIQSYQATAAKISLDHNSATGKLHAVFKSC